MSKIGKKPIIIPDNVEVKMNDGNLEFKGKAGSLEIRMPPYVKVEIKDKSIIFSPEDSSKQAKANWGTIRSLSNSAILGVMSGFQKILEIEGIGYRANIEGNTLLLNIGFSHPVKVNPPEGVKIEVVKNTIKVSGINKDLVGRTAAFIRSLRRTEPYKGKGIRYQGEVIRRKSGKKVAGAGTAVIK